MNNNKHLYYVGHYEYTPTQTRIAAERRSNIDFLPTDMYCCIRPVLAQTKAEAIKLFTARQYCSYRKTHKHTNNIS